MYAIVEQIGHTDTASDSVVIDLDGRHFWGAVVGVYIGEIVAQDERANLIALADLVLGIEST